LAKKVWRFSTGLRPLPGESFLSATYKGQTMRSKTSEWRPWTRVICHDQEIAVQRKMSITAEDLVVNSYADHYFTSGTFEAFGM